MHPLDKCNGIENEHAVIVCIRMMQSIAMHEGKERRGRGGGREITGPRSALFRTFLFNGIMQNQSMAYYWIYRIRCARDSKDRKCTGHKPHTQTHTHTYWISFDTTYKHNNRCKHHVFLDLFIYLLL